jgi:uncharacterized protein
VTDEADIPLLDEATVVRSAASVATPHASRYLQQLCKHFAHKRPASFDARRGRIAFAIGLCELDTFKNLAVWVGL